MKTGNLIMAPTLLQTHPACKTVLTIWQNMKGEIQKSQFEFSIPFMNWDRIPTKATFKYPSFQSFCELGKSSKYSLRPTFKNYNFKSKDELRKAMSQFELHYLK